MTPWRKSKIQISVVSVFLIILVFVFYHVLSNTNFWKNPNTEEYALPHVYSGRDVTKQLFKEVVQCSKSGPFNGEKLIHLDLKGAPPLVSYYEEFFPYIRKLGATGVLIEYEDMFFYKDELEDIRALNAYQPHMIKNILQLAERNNLMVVPLIQTFGHFEFVLKLEKYKDLREINLYPQVLCPSHEKVLSLLKKMIDQVLEAHPKSKYIHIGCDEVLYLGQCNRCRSAIQENNWSNAELFLNHVKTIASYINKTYPGVRPIMWGDMVGRFSEPLVIKSQISSLVDLMIWKYVPNVSDYITDDMLEMFARVFKTLWIASAFKGATGVNQKITDSQYHLDNHISWMEIVSKWKKFIHFKGIALTGWQRYDHFAELCELLPVAIPSLTISLTYLNNCSRGPSDRDFLKKLQCDCPFSIPPDTLDYSLKPCKCAFPGFRVFKLINKFYSFSMKISSHFAAANRGWFSAYGVLHQFSSPAYVKDIFDKWPLDEHLRELKDLEGNLKSALLEVYDEYTVEEWTTTYLAPLRIRMEAYWVAKEAMLERNAWPRRPLLNNADGLEKAAKEICTSDRKFGCALLLI